MTNEQKTMTFADLKAALDKLTTEQLAMPVYCCSDSYGGAVYELDILQEDHVSVDGEAMEPVGSSSYTEEELAEGDVVTILKGTPHLCF